MFGPQNLALCEVLGSKCDKKKCGKHSGKFVKLNCFGAIIAVCCRDF